MKSTNKKILHTKQVLRATLCSLIESKNINDISVSEVCREAKINRTTFYKYYSLPIDIINEFSQEIMEGALRQITMNKSPATGDDFYHMILAIIRMYYENQQIMKIYMEFNKDLMPMMQRFIKDNNSLELKDSSLTYFIAGGVASIIVQWGRNGFKQSPEEVAKVLTKYILKLQYNTKIQQVGK